MLNPGSELCTRRASRIRPARRLGTFAVVLLAALVGLTGCVILPIPPFRRMSEGVEIQKDDLTWIRVGISDRLEFLNRLGPPDIDFVDRLTIAYAWSGTRAVVVSGGSAPVLMRRALLIRFDEAGRVAAFTIVDRPWAVTPYAPPEPPPDIPLMDWRTVIHGWLAGEPPTPAVPSAESVILVRFRTEGTPPRGGDFSEKWAGRSYEWIFAAANERTGWSFRRLMAPGQIFRAGRDPLQPDPKSTGSGWLIFRAPTGNSYLTVTPLGIPGVSKIMATRDPYYAMKSHPDRIVLEDTGRWKKVSELRAAELQDFIDEPRFAVQITGPGSVIYAGTIVCTIRCTPESTLRCPHELTVVDESGLARAFTSRHRNLFPADWPQQTRLLAIPSSRTIEIRGGSDAMGFRTDGTPPDQTRKFVRP